MFRILLLLIVPACTSSKVELGDRAGETGFEGDEEETSGILEVSPSSADLGLLFVGATATATFTVENVGTAPLSLTTEVASAFEGAWTLVLSDSTPGPGDTTDLTMTLMPTVFGDHAAEVTVRDTSGSDDVVALTLAAEVQVDSDGDGAGSVASGGADCDDADAEAYLGAPEVWYDGVDQDCVGGDDFDQDGDGAQVDADCDDTDASVLPGAADSWYDGVDQDCRGDDDFDQDQDGSRYDEDCDDTDATVHPGSVETWYDGVDQDCDGASDYDQDGDAHDTPADCDDEDATVHPGALDAWYDGVDSDCLGNDDDDQDADGVLVGSDCDDTDASVVAPATEAWNGRDDDCDGMVDDLGVASVSAGVLYGSSTDAALGASHTLALGGDIDDDGGDDLVAVSATPATGSAWVVAGVDALAAAGAIESYDSAFFYGSSTYPLSHVSGPMGDLTGSDVTDVVINGTTSSRGRAYLTTRSSGTVDLSTSNTAYVDGDTSSDTVRWSVVGDVDGDGVKDWVVGTPDRNHYTYSTQAGCVSLFEGGSFSGQYQLNDSDGDAFGADDGDYLGTSLAIGDVTGDGYADVLAGAPNNDDGASNGGAVYVVAGAASGWGGGRASALADTTILGTSSGQGLGNDPLATPGDLDGDGVLDLALSATASGEVWVFFDVAGTPGDVDVTDADAAWSGTANSFASALAGGSDLDGDGIEDLVIGASGDDTAAADAGALFLFLGGGAWTSAMTSADADATIYGTAAEDGLGTGLAAGGDLDSDGVDDLLMGASGVDTVASGGGAVYVLLGVR